MFGDLTLLWIFVAYIVVNLLMHAVLITVSVIIGRRICKSCKCAKSGCKCANKPRDAVEMTGKDGEEKVALPEKKEEEEDEKKERKEPPEGSIYFWVAMGVNIVIITAFSLTFLVLIAFPQ